MVDERFFFDALRQPDTFALEFFLWRRIVLMDVHIRFARDERFSLSAIDLKLLHIKWELFCVELLGMRVGFPARWVSSDLDRHFGYRR